MNSEDTETLQAVQSVKSEIGQHRARPKPNTEITPAPMCEGVTLFQWLKNNHPLKDNVWPAVVQEFYKRALSAPEIADYFRDTDLDSQRKHFHRALVLVTNTGVTQATLDFLRNRHANVRSSENVGITIEIYGLVVTTLVQILREQYVPEEGIANLAQTIEPLKDVIVH